MLTSRSTVRSQQFAEKVERLSEQIERAEEIIDGALWEIARNPNCGVYLSELDVWMAPLVEPPIRLYYCRNRRYVHMLTMESTDERLVL